MPRRRYCKVRPAFAGEIESTACSKSVGSDQRAKGIAGNLYGSGPFPPIWLSNRYEPHAIDCRTTGIRYHILEIVKSALTIPRIVVGRVLIRFIIYVRYY